MVTVHDYFHSSQQGAKGLFPSNYLEPSNRLERARAASQRELAPEVLVSLQTQNKGSPTLELLDGRPVAFAVTGQQLGLFGGPLFTLYKIASAVKLAEQLTRETGITVLPLFWLQSEDHDYEEIRSASFFGRDGEIASTSLPETPAGRGGPVGKITITSEAAASLRAFLETTFSQRVPEERIAALSSIYGEGQTLSQAMAALVKYCFGGTQLLVLDAHTPGLKKLSRPLLLRFFKEHSHIEKLLEGRSAALEARGLSITVPLRHGYPLPFLELNGKRERVRKEEPGTFQTSTGPLSATALEALDPLLITTSALARPLFQDFLIPTAAYVAGSTEFNYWAQLPELYDFFGITMPLVVPRAHLTILPENRVRILNEESLSLTDAHLPLGKLLAQKLEGSEDSSEHVFRGAEKHLSDMHGELQSNFTRTNSQALKESLDVTTQSLRHNLEKLKGKYSRLLAERHTTFSQRVEKLQKILLPQGVPQERAICLAHYLLLEGTPFIERLLSSLSFPFPPDVQLLTVSPEQKGLSESKGVSA